MTAQDRGQRLALSDAPCPALWELDRVESEALVLM
jgi:hypothetical protein